MVLWKAVARIHKRTDLLVEDRVLLKDFKRGEPSALTRLYSVYVKDIVEFLKRGFSFNAAGNPYFFRGYKEPWHLENAVQEVFIKAFSESARLAYDGVRPFRNYLFRIARNTVMDDFRLKKTDLIYIEEMGSVDDQDIPQHVDASDPERDLLDKQLMAQVDAFVSQLEADARSLFEVRFLNGESVEECARILHWSEYKVKREEKRIKKQFFDQLKKQGYFEGYQYRNPSIRNLTVTALLTTCRWCI